MSIPKWLSRLTRRITQIIILGLSYVVGDLFLRLLNPELGLKDRWFKLLSKPIPLWATIVSIGLILLIVYLSLKKRSPKKIKFMNTKKDKKIRFRFEWNRDINPKLYPNLVKATPYCRDCELLLEKTFDDLGEQEGWRCYSCGYGISLSSLYKLEAQIKSLLIKTL